MTGGAETPATSPHGVGCQIADPISIPSSTPAGLARQLTGADCARVVASATGTGGPLVVAPGGVHAARPGQIRALTLADADLWQRRLVVAGNPRRMDELTRQVLLDRLVHRRTAWAHTANPHLLLTSLSARPLAPVSPTWLSWVAATDPCLHRAHLLKEGLRLIFQMLHEQAGPALDRWVSWARRCRIPAFVTLQRRIVKHRARILAAIEHHLSNGLVESTNTKIRLITRMAYGFASPQPLIALAQLSLGGHRPSLPGRK